MIRMLAAVIGLCALVSLASWARDGIYEQGQRAGRAEVRLDFAHCNQALANADEATIAAERNGERAVIEIGQFAQQLADEAKRAEESLAQCRANSQFVCRNNPAADPLPLAARSRGPPQSAL